MKIVKDYWIDMTIFFVGLISYPTIVLALYIYTH